MASKPDTTAGAPVSEADVRLAGMDLLARREHGREELAAKLKRRFSRRELAPGLIDAALDRLVVEGLLDETRYAESLLRQLLNKGIGPQRLEAELRQRALPSNARAHIQPVIEAIDWFDQAETVYRRKFRSPVVSHAYEAVQKEKAKRVRFMQYRGFMPEHYRHLIDALLLAEESDPMH